ncbi:hypothetical protein FB107DRAFT_279965 [Schizophyllum commune]
MSDALSEGGDDASERESTFLEGALGTSLLSESSQHVWSEVEPAHRMGLLPYDVPGAPVFLHAPIPSRVFGGRDILRMARSSPLERDRTPSRSSEDDYQTGSFVESDHDSDLDNMTLFSAME